MEGGARVVGRRTAKACLSELKQMKVGLARVQLQDWVVRIGRPPSVVANGEERGIAIDESIRKVLGVPENHFSTETTFHIQLRNTFDLANHDNNSDPVTLGQLKALVGIVPKPKVIYR